MRDDMMRAVAFIVVNEGMATSKTKSTMHRDQLLLVSQGA